MVVLRHALSYGATGNIQRMDFSRRLAGLIVSHPREGRRSETSEITVRSSGRPRHAAEIHSSGLPLACASSFPRKKKKAGLSGGGTWPKPTCSVYRCGYGLLWAISSVAAFRSISSRVERLPHFAMLHATNVRPRSSTAMWVSPQCTSSAISDRMRSEALLGEDVLVPVLCDSWSGMHAQPLPTTRLSRASSRCARDFRALD